MLDTFPLDTKPLDTIPKEVRDFKDTFDPQQTISFNKQLLQIEVNDKKQKVGMRFWIAVALGALLICQNIAVFVFVYIAFFYGTLQNFATVISIICSATLMETATIVYTMVKWIFSDIKHELHEIRK